MQVLSFLQGIALADDLPEVVMSTRTALVLLLVMAFSTSASADLMQSDHVTFLGGVEREPNFLRLLRARRVLRGVTPGSGLRLENNRRTREVLTEYLHFLETESNIAASNVANHRTTRTIVGGPYRKMIASIDERGRTVVSTDPRGARRAFDPTHPDADTDGFVSLPNISVEEECRVLHSVGVQYDQITQSLRLFDSSLALERTRLWTGSVCPSDALTTPL